MMIWFGCLVINFFILIYLYLLEWIEKDNFLWALKELNLIYAPFIGAIALFYWGHGKQTKSHPDINSKPSFTLAIATSIFWNAIPFSFLFLLLFQHGTIEDSISDVKDINAIFSWIASGAIGY